MRYVPLEYLKEGMIVAKPILNSNGDVLITEGTKIKLQYMPHLATIVGGVYIEDYISEGIVIENLVSENLKIDATKKIKEFYSTPKKATFKDVNDCGLTMDSIIEELISSKNLVIDLIDIKAYDDYTFYHSLNVAIFSIILGSTLNLDKNKLYKLAMGALFHDIGKTFISTDILNKPGKLTPEEFEVIKSHPEKGFTYTKNILKLSTTSYMGIIHHHEKWDGTGYPNKLKENEISLFGQIISIADVYDALISERPYKKAFLPFEGIRYLLNNSGTFFNPMLVKKFISKIAPYPVGLGVELSSGECGIIMKNHEHSPLTPIIKIVSKDNILLTNNYIVDLNSSSHADKKIINIVNF